MTDSPFALLAEFETTQALAVLGQIARGRTIAPSIAAKAAETMEKYPRRFSEVSAGSEELLTELHDSLLTPSEYLFGHGLSEEACEND